MRYESKVIRLRVPSVLRVLAITIREWWDAWLPLLLINLVALPCVLLIILGPPAVFGIYDAANSLAHGQIPTVRNFLMALRRYFIKSWQWTLPNVLFGFFAWNSFRFYNTFNTDIGIILQLLVLCVVIAWSLIQFYALPYLIEQDGKSLMRAWRNGAYTLLASPFYTIMIMGISALIIELMSLLPPLLFLGGPCFFALFGTRAVFERLETFGIRVRDTTKSP